MSFHFLPTSVFNYSPKCVTIVQWLKCRRQHISHQTFYRFYHWTIPCANTQCQSYIFSLSQQHNAAAWLFCFVTIYNIWSVIIWQSDGAWHKTTSQEWIVVVTCCFLPVFATIKSEIPKTFSHFLPLKSSIGTHNKQRFRSIISLFHFSAGRRRCFFDRLCFYLRRNRWYCNTKQMWRCSGKRGSRGARGNIYGAVVIIVKLQDRSYW